MEGQGVSVRNGKKIIKGVGFRVRGLSKHFTQGVLGKIGQPSKQPVSSVTGFDS